MTILCRLLIDRFLRPSGTVPSRCSHFHGFRSAPPVATVGRPFGADNSTGLRSLYVSLQLAAPLVRVNVYCPRPKNGVSRNTDLGRSSKPLNITVAHPKSLANSAPK